MIFITFFLFHLVNCDEVKIFDGSVYFYSSVSRYFNESSKICESRGMRMAEIRSREEDIFLSSWANRAFIGAECHEDRNQEWKWLDNTSMVYSNLDELALNPYDRSPYLREDYFQNLPRECTEYRLHLGSWKWQPVYNEKHGVACKSEASEYVRNRGLLIKHTIEYHNTTCNQINRTLLHIKSYLDALNYGNLLQKMAQKVNFSIHLGGICDPANGLFLWDDGSAIQDLFGINLACKVNQSLILHVNTLKFETVEQNYVTYGFCLKKVINLPGLFQGLEKEILLKINVFFVFVWSIILLVLLFITLFVVTLIALRSNQQPSKVTEPNIQMDIINNRI